MVEGDAEHPPAKVRDVDVVRQSEDRIVAVPESPARAAQQPRRRADVGVGEDDARVLGLGQRLDHVVNLAHASASGSRVKDEDVAIRVRGGEVSGHCGRRIRVALEGDDDLEGLFGIGVRDGLEILAHAVVQAPHGLDQSHRKQRLVGTGVVPAEVIDADGQARVEPQDHEADEAGQRRDDEGHEPVDCTKKC